MSQVKSTEIDGDVAIGRHVTIGGDVTVQGNTTVKKNLKVQGWLEAKNIKSSHKGLFSTPTKLREVYPHPHEGWYALVGQTLPAQVYIAEGGDWVPQKTADGTPIMGGPVVDLSDYSSAIDDLREDVEDLQKTVRPAVRCTDEADLAAKAALDIYAEGQEFYIPEEE